MMTIVTHVTLEEGTEPEWDAAMRDRLMVIIGTWQSRAHWEAWHNNPEFTATRRG